MHASCSFSFALFWTLVCFSCPGSGNEASNTFNGDKNNRTIIFGFPPDFPETDPGNSFFFPWYPPGYPEGHAPNHPSDLSVLFLYIPAIVWSQYFNNLLLNQVSGFVSNKEINHHELTNARLSIFQKIKTVIPPTESVILLFPVYEQRSEASASPEYIERQDVEYEGKPCNHCSKLFSANDIVIFSSCQHLFHQHCLRTLESCPSCDGDLRAEANALTATPVSKPEQPLTWGELIQLGDLLIQKLPPADTRSQHWRNNIAAIKIRRTLSNWMIDHKLETQPSEPSSDQLASSQKQLDDMIENLCDGELPMEFPGVSDLSSDEFKQLSDTYRPLFLELGLHAIITRQWITRLISKIGSSSCLEVCAGRGWLAMALQHFGVIVIPTDLAPYEPVVDVGEISAVDAIHHDASFDFLIMSWPPPDSPVAYHCISALHRGQLIIYLGEWRGGCCANNNFFDSVEIIEKIKIPNWFGFNDAVYILRKKIIGTARKPL